MSLICITAQILLTYANVTPTVLNVGYLLFIRPIHLKEFTHTRTNTAE